MTPEEKKAFFNQRFSIRGNIHYTRALFTPQANKEELKKNPNAPKKFSTVLSWNPHDQVNAATLHAMNAFIARAKQEINPQIPDQFYVWPVKQYDTYRRMDGKQGADFLKGKHWINLSSGEKYRPKVVDTNKMDLIDESIVYSGVQAIVSFSFYDMGAGQSQSKKGLGVNIIAVMVLGGGTPDPIGEFNVNLDEVFGSFQADMNQPMGQGYGQQQAPAAPQYQQQQYAPPAQPNAPVQPAYNPQQGQYGQPAPQAQPAYMPPYPAQPQSAPAQPQYAPPAQPQYAPPAQPQQGQQYNQQGQPLPPGWAGPQY